MSPVSKIRPFLPRLLFSLTILIIPFLATRFFSSQPRALGPDMHSNLPTQGASFSELSDLAMVSSTEGWAVGYAEPCSSGRMSSCHPLLKHNLHSTWSSVPLPFSGALNTVSMLSATDGWAGGYEGLLLHYDGHAWQHLTDPQGISFLHLQMFSDTDGWAIGAPREPAGTEILHDEGGTWTAQVLPTSLGTGMQYDLSPQALAMLSPQEGWAVGSLIPRLRGGTSTTSPRAAGGAVTLHYRAGHWTISTFIPDADLQSISMSSATEGWAVGDTETTKLEGPTTPRPTEVQTPLLLHYTRGKWLQEANPINNPMIDFLNTVSMTSMTDGWSAGPQGGLAPLPLATMLHYNGRRWSEVRMPMLTNTGAMINRIAMISATEGWAVGSLTRAGIGTSDVTTPLILHYQHGAWSLYDSHDSSR